MAGGEPDGDIQADVVQETQAYAKRQATWFRHQLAGAPDLGSGCRAPGSRLPSPGAGMRPEAWYEGRTSLDLARGDGWAWIGLRSGDGLNRLHSDLLVALDRLFIELRWAGIRRVALSGSGWMTGRGRHFSAGADLHEVGALDPVSAEPFARRGQRVMGHLLWRGLAHPHGDLRRGHGGRL